MWSWRHEVSLCLIRKCLPLNAPILLIVSFCSFRYFCCCLNLYISLNIRYLMPLWITSGWATFEAEKHSHVLRTVYIYNWEMYTHSLDNYRAFKNMQKYTFMTFHRFSSTCHSFLLYTHSTWQSTKIWQQLAF